MQQDHHVNMYTIFVKEKLVGDILFFFILAFKQIIGSCFSNHLNEAVL